MSDTQMAPVEEAMGVQALVRGRRPCLASDGRDTVTGRRIALAMATAIGFRVSARTREGTFRREFSEDECCVAMAAAKRALEHSTCRGVDLYVITRDCFVLVPHEHWKQFQISCAPPGLLDGAVGPEEAARLGLPSSVPEVECQP